MAFAGLFKNFGVVGRQIRQISLVPRNRLFFKSIDKNTTAPSPFPKKSLVSRILFGKIESPTSTVQDQVPMKRSLFSRIFFREKKSSKKSWFKMGALAGGGSVILLMYSFRRYRDSLVMGFSWPVHHDRSEVSIASAKPQVVPTVKIVTNTSSSATIIDEEKYSEFVKKSIEDLMIAQKEMEQEASRLLAERVDHCFQKIEPRSEKFADWYFSYSTSFKLIQEATMSLARHAAKVFEETPINDAVSADMDKFMTQKYERIVLRPEINNSELQSAYLACIKEIHERYLQTISSIDRNMSELVDSETTHIKQPQAADVKLSLDWSSQMHKIKSVPVNFEKNPELTLALSSGGAIVGKTLASKGASMATTKVFVGKLSAPFVSKAIAAGGGAVAGSVAGPVGTVMGATLGLGIDYSVNAGIELMKREEFISDVTQVVKATKSDYYHVLEEELHRAVRVWTEDAIQLLPSVSTFNQKKQDGNWLNKMNQDVGSLLLGSALYITKLVS